MRSERDLLHNSVFPEIRKEILPLGEDIQEIDLRWGVDTSRMSEEKSSRYVITTCLDTIDQCRPYLIVLLGERYGWIPDTETVARLGDTRLKKLFAGDISITNAEILYGALQEENALDHCIFCFRDPAFVKMIPPSHRSTYEAEDPAHAAKQEMLKQQIRESGAKILTYSPSWDAEKEELTGLTPFAEDLEAALREMLAKDLPERKTGLSEEERILLHGDYLRKQLISDYAERPSVTTYQKGSTWISGETGCGKSAFLAKEASRGTGLGYPVFLYFGAEPGCYETAVFLKTLLFWLRKQTGAETQYPEGQQKMPEEMMLHEISRLAGKMKELYLFIDAPEAMDEGILPVLLFLAEKVIGNVSGKTMNVASSDHYLLTRPAVTETFRLWEMRPLNEKEQRAVIRAHAEKRWKHVDEETAEAILKKENSGNARYLTLALERLFMMNRRDFEASDSFGEGMSGLSAFMRGEVERMPEDTVGLSLYLLDSTVQNLREDLTDLEGETILNFRETEDPFEILTWLAVSENGLLLREIEKILTDRRVFFPTVLLERLFGSLQELFGTDAEGRWRIADAGLREHLLRQVPREKFLLSPELLQSRRFFEICTFTERGIPAYEELLEDLVRKYPEEISDLILASADRLLTFRKLKTAVERISEKEESGIRTVFAAMALLKNETDRSGMLRCGRRLLLFFGSEENLKNADEQTFSRLAEALVPMLVSTKYSPLLNETFGIAHAALKHVPETGHLREFYAAMDDWAVFLSSKPAGRMNTEEKKNWCARAAAFAVEFRERKPAGTAWGLFYSWVLLWIGQELIIYRMYDSGYRILSSAPDTLLAYCERSGYWCRLLRADAYLYLQDAVKDKYKEKYAKLELQERTLQCAFFPCTETVSDLARTCLGLGNVQWDLKKEDDAEGTWRKGTEICEYARRGKGTELADEDIYSLKLYFVLVMKLAQKYFKGRPLADDDSFPCRRILEKYKDTLAVTDRSIRDPQNRNIVSGGHFGLGRYLFFIRKEGGGAYLRKAMEINREIWNVTKADADLILKQTLSLLEMAGEAAKPLLTENRTEENERFSAEEQAKDGLIRLAEECLDYLKNRTDTKKWQFRLDLIRAERGDAAALAMLREASKQEESCSELERLFIRSVDPEEPVGKLTEDFSVYWRKQALEEADELNQKKFREQSLFNHILRRIGETFARKETECRSENDREAYRQAAEILAEDPEIQAFLQFFVNHLWGVWTYSILDGPYYPEADFGPEKEGWIRAVLIYRASSLYDGSRVTSPERCAAIFLMEKEMGGGGLSVPEKELLAECYFRCSLFLKKGIPGEAASASEGLRRVREYSEKNGFTQLAEEIRTREFMFLYLEERAQELENSPVFAEKLVRSFEENAQEAKDLENRAEDSFGLRDTAPFERAAEYLAYRMLSAEREECAGPEEILDKMRLLADAYRYVETPLSRAVSEEPASVRVHLGRIYSILAMRFSESVRRSGAAANDFSISESLKNGLRRAAGIWTGIFFGGSGGENVREELWKEYAEAPEGWQQIASFAARNGQAVLADSILYYLLFAAGNAGGEEPALREEQFTGILECMKRNIRPCLAEGISNNLFIDHIQEIWKSCASKYPVRAESPAVSSYAAYVKEAAAVFGTERYDGSYKGMHMYICLADAYLTALRSLHESCGDDMERKEKIERDMIAAMQHMADIADTPDKRSEISEFDDYINYILEEGVACRQEAKEIRNFTPKLEAKTLETEMIRFLSQHPDAGLEDFLKQYNG